VVKTAEEKQTIPHFSGRSADRRGEQSRGRAKRRRVPESSSSVAEPARQPGGRCGDAFGICWVLAYFGWLALVIRGD
jgi:hypothetical protein